MAMFAPADESNARQFIKWITHNTNYNTVTERMNDAVSNTGIPTTVSYCACVIPDAIGNGTYHVIGRLNSTAMTSGRDPLFVCE
jgi:hypothetical protein